MRGETTLLEAQFNPAVRHYWLITGSIILVVTIVGVVLLPFWLIGGLWITGRYLARMECTLTDRSLHVKKGLLTRVEKNIPLDKITDLGLVQGPIMRAMKLEQLSVETAGSSGGAQGGALVRMTGIVGARAFRDAVVEQRDRIVEGATPTGFPASTPAGAPAQAEGLVGGDALLDIRDTLRRIEAELQEKRP